MRLRLGLFEFEERRELERVGRQLVAGRIGHVLEVRRVGVCMVELGLGVHKRAQLGLEAVETDFTRHDVYTADECFLTGSAAELIPVVAVDAREIGDGKPGPITARILSAFGEFVKNDDN